MTATSLLAKEIAEALLPLLIEKLGGPVGHPNECMTVPQIAKELKLGHRVVVALIDAGTLPRVPDIRERRVRRSVVAAYGTQAK